MKYMLLIYGSEPTEPPTEQAIQQEIDAYWAYEKAVADAGVFVASDALQGVETATTLQVRADGERVVTDGPFAETREVLGGYYLLDVPDLDAALDWAARCPGSRNGGKVEVRPVDGVRGAVTRGRAAGSVGSVLEEVVFREERGRLLATLVRQFGDLDLAEEVASDAMTAALRALAGRRGAGEAGRLAAHHRASQGRRPAAARPHLRRPARAAAGRGRPRRTGRPVDADDDDVPDERLRLFFTCCHPALPLEAQTALTLRCLAGLATPEVARAFLVPTRDDGPAHRAGQAQDPGRAHPVPRAEAAELPDRLPGVLRVVYLIFTEGYAASGGPELVRAELADEAIRLARILHRLLPDEREVAGLLALLLLVDARRAARTGHGRRAGAARRPGPLAVGPPTASPRVARSSSRRAAGRRRRDRTRCRPRSRPCTTRRPTWPPPTGRRWSRSTTCSRGWRRHRWSS